MVTMPFSSGNLFVGLMETQRSQSGKRHLAFMGHPKHTTSKWDVGNSKPPIGISRELKNPQRKSLGIPQTELSSHCLLFQALLYRQPTLFLLYRPLLTSKLCFQVFFQTFFSES